MKFIVEFPEYSLCAFALGFELQAVPKNPSDRKGEGVGRDATAADFEESCSDTTVEFLKVLRKYDYFIVCCRIE
jgi:hypothetical protein